MQYNSKVSQKGQIQIRTLPKIVPHQRTLEIMIGRQSHRRGSSYGNEWLQKAKPMFTAKPTMAAAVRIIWLTASHRTGRRVSRTAVANPAAISDSMNPNRIIMCRSPVVRGPWSVVPCSRGPIPSAFISED